MAKTTRKTIGPGQRQPSLTGSVMIDIVNGKTRVRAWPKKRGKRKSPEQQDNVDKFTQCQRSFRYSDPKMALDITQAREGTPLLPRDIWTSMLYATLFTLVDESGKAIWSMASKQNVSDALDIIANQPGQMLRRGQQIWEPTGPTGETGWTVIADQQITAPTAVWTSPDLSAFDTVAFLVMGLSASVAAQRGVQMRQSTTGSWMTNPGDYARVQADGSMGTGAFAGLTDQQTAAQIAAIQVWTGLRGTMPAWTLASSRTGVGLTQNKSQPVDRFRFANGNPATPSGTMTTGRIVLMGK